MKKLGKYGKKVSCVVIGMLCAAAIGACGSTQSGSQDEKDVRNDISVYEEGADLEGTLTYGTLFIEPQTQHMIDLFMKEHPGVKIETKVVFDNDVTDEQYNEGLNTLLTELASDQRADIYDATYLPSEIKTKGSGYFEDLNQYIDADPNFNRDDYYDNILRASDGAPAPPPAKMTLLRIRLSRNNAAMATVLILPRFVIPITIQRIIRTPITRHQIHLPVCITPSAASAPS